MTPHSLAVWFGREGSQAGPGRQRSVVSPVGGRGHARDRHTLFPAFHLSFVDRLPKLIEFLPDTEGTRQPYSLTNSLPQAISPLFCALSLGCGNPHWPFPCIDPKVTYWYLRCLFFKLAFIFLACFFFIVTVERIYRGLYSAQNIVKKDPGRTRQSR